MPIPITSYGTSCRTKDSYIADNYTIIELSGGTVGLYDPTSNPIVAHETKPCCELLGYTFDETTQKCRWALDSDELFKVILNPQGNSSTLFSTDENETCSLEVSFDYLFLFECDKLREARAEGIGISIADLESVDDLETSANTITVECDFYQSIIDDAELVPYVIQYLAPGVVGPDGTIKPSTPSLYYGGNLPPLAYGIFDPNVVSYCLTDLGKTEWEATVVTGGTWSASYGTDTTTYTNAQVEAFINSEPNPGDYHTSVCNYSIYDRQRAEDTITTYEAKVKQCDIDKKVITDKIDALLPSALQLDKYLPLGVCNTYIDMFEQFETAFTLEIESTGSTKILTSVYEESLLNIGSNNLYDYINSTSGKTGIIITGDTGLMPTLAETTLLSPSPDLCTQIRDNLVTDLFTQYLETNELPQTQQEQVGAFNELTSWYQSCWLQFNTKITDPYIIGLIENRKINISISIKDSCVDFSILLDRIKMEKVCTKVDNVTQFISEPPKFELTKVCDNKKSWIKNTSPDERFFDLKYRGTEYDTNHHRLVINTKEVDLNLSPSRAVEQDVWCYINDNNGILEGCLSDNEVFSTFSCPSGYTTDVDNNSCTELTVTSATTSATTYTVGTGIGLTNTIHYLSRGVIFVEDITDKEWPIYWTGTTTNGWVGPYYNTDYLTDYSGKYLNHTGFGTNKFTDGTLQYSSPDAFSGLFSKFGKDNADIVAGALNPNILWGGTNGSVSASTFNNVTGSNNAGRLLNASVWSNPGTSPILECIGLSYTLNLTETKVYRLGFAGDDDVKVKINGKYIFNSTTTPLQDPNIHKNFSISYSRTIQTYLVMGIQLSAGKNIIEVEGYNNSIGIAGFVLEMYDATEAQLKNMKFESELESVRVFSTLDRVGSVFNLGEKSANSCPSGYAFDSGANNCVKIDKLTRKEKQLDEYCPCPDFPIIVNDYENVVTELPLTASTNVFTCTDISTLVLNYTNPTTPTTIEAIDVIKGGDVYAIGFKTPSNFDNFWLSEENDGTLGVYDVEWNPAGGNYVCSCPTGYVATVGNNGCQAINTNPATFNGAGSAVLATPKDATHGDFGTFFYPEVTNMSNLPLTRDFGTSGRNLETQTGTQVVPTLVINNTYPPFISNSFWDAFDANTGRINNVGVRTSDNEWKGFSYCIEVPIGKVYYIGVGSRWFFKVSIDGNTILEVGGPDNPSTNYRAWHIIPYFLTPGKHIIEMEGLGKIFQAPSFFGAEIYDPVSYAALTGATNTTDAGVIFSTANKVGSNFDLGLTVGYSCPVGFALDTCAAGTPVCSEIISTSITCANVPSVKSYQNVSNQVDSTCCKVIDEAFETYADLKNQGINTYPSLTWDSNKSKCVYTKCGDSGCNNLDEELTTELNKIDTVKEFASVLSSELIDVKSRQTLSGYPTLRMLYDRYNSRSEEFCGINSSKYDYSDMDTFGQTVGNYWIDLIEQVVPATAIWGSTYAYKNTVFDTQKFKYKNNNIYFDIPTVVPTLGLNPFEFLVLEYQWDPNIGGTDLDTRTSLNGTSDPWTGTNGDPMGPDGNIVGYGMGAEFTGSGPAKPRRYVGPYGNTTGTTHPNHMSNYMIWGGDCTSNCDSEQVLINFKSLLTDYPSTSISDFLVDIESFWCNKGSGNGDITINMTTYSGGTMNLVGLGFTNTGGNVIDIATFDINVLKAAPSGTANICQITTGESLGQIKYSKSLKTATLISSKPTSSPVTITNVTPPPPLPPGPLPPVPLASSATVSVITEILPSPITATGSTITLLPTITKSNGVWIKDDGCESDFLGTVTTTDINGAIIPS